MANCNEQYSRKFNIKVTNFSEENDENLNENFVKMVKDELKLEINNNDIIAIHRLKTRRQGVPPLIVKMKNSDIKTQVMRRKKQLKGKTRMYDDITVKNRDLIQQLKQHDDIETAYYYNCYIYGVTKDGTQIPFDICDDIDSKIDYELNRNSHNSNDR